MLRTSRFNVRGACAAFCSSLIFLVCFGPKAIAQFCPDSGTVHSTTDQTTDDAPLVVRCCDIDGDGDPDLVTANDGSDTVSVLINNGDGTYAPKVQWSVDDDPASTAEPVDVACCDVNGDGHVDLISVNHTSDDVSVLLNDGSFQFTLSGRYTVGEAPFGIECLNLDGDADNDLVTNGFTEDAISVLLNNGDGTFAGHVTYAAGDAPIAMALCDVDNDSDQDVVTANMLSKDVSVLRNNADGTFTNIGSADLCTGPTDCVNPFDIACCDLDGVNGPDVVTANGIADTITLLFNDGTGSYGGLTSYPGVDGAWAVTCCDLDGDMDSDIMSANMVSDDLAVFLNNGDGTLGTPLFLSVGSDSTANPSSVVCCNVDGDGDNDLVNTFVDGVTVFENDCGGCTADEDCDDGNVCTDDTCEAGTCQYTNNTAPCDDGDPCNVGEACLSGVCTGGGPPDCSGAGDQCNTASCDPVGAEGNCDTLTAVEDGTICDDGLFCTETDTCSGGACVGSGDPCPGQTCDEENDTCVSCTTNADCDDDNVCTDDACEAGACQYTSNTAPCDDGDPCNIGEACQSGVCTGGAPPDCSSAGDQCNTASCDPVGAEGNCGTLTPVTDGTACDDGNACNIGETCQSGVCTGSAPPDCSSAGDQCNTASCDPAGAEGNCDILTPVQDGTICNDGLFCTLTDTCSGGTCDGTGDPCPGQLCDEANNGCVDCLTNADCPEGMFCGEYGVCSSCPAPVVVTEGSRYFGVTPQPGPPEQAIWVTGEDPDVSCVYGYVRGVTYRGKVEQCDNPPCEPDYLPPGPEGWDTIHVRGFELIGGKTYSIQTDCDPANPGTVLSEPVSATLWQWGDTDNWGGVDIRDVTRILDGFRGIFHTFDCETDEDCMNPPVPPYFTCDTAVYKCLSATLENIDVYGATGCLPERVISILDVTIDLDAFRGFPDPCAVTCP